jgi:hypothetical protein
MPEMNFTENFSTVHFQAQSKLRTLHSNISAIQNSRTLQKYHRTTEPIPLKMVCNVQVGYALGNP